MSGRGHLGNANAGWITERSVPEQSERNEREKQGTTLFEVLTSEKEQGRMLRRSSPAATGGAGRDHPGRATKAPHDSVRPFSFGNMPNHSPNLL
jgi:hypothetical protein